MAAPKLRGEYNQLQQIAGKFTAEQRRAGDMQRAIKADVERLRNGDWIGRGADRFYGEMDASVLPTINRLMHALGEAARVTGQINQLLQQAEVDAARILDKEPGVPKPTPPVPKSPLAEPTPVTSHVTPRFYVINGINNDGNGNAHLERYLRDNLKKYLPDSDVKLFEGSSIKGIYDSNLQKYADGIPNQRLKDVVTSLLYDANTIVGVGQTIREYVTGGAEFTDRAEAQIAEDLARNPLLPGQTVVLVGHSGGGVIVSNLAARLEAKIGVDVSNVITLGAPIVNRDAVTRVAHLIEIRDSRDMVGIPYIRSEESRNLFFVALSPFALSPLFIAGEWLLRDRGTNSTSFETHSDPSSDAHGSYWVSNTVFDIIKPAFGIE